jgi:transcriptional regulator with XRE-family HTH domain
VCLINEALSHCLYKRNSGMMGLGVSTSVLYGATGCFAGVRGLFFLSPCYPNTSNSLAQKKGVTHNFSLRTRKEAAVLLPKLAQWRMARGETQRTLWRKSDVHHTTIARAETGYSVSPRTARKLADALHVEVVDLVDPGSVPLSAPLAVREEATTRVHKDIDLRWRVVDEALELAQTDPQLFSDRAKERLSEEEAHRLGELLLDSGAA